MRRMLKDSQRMSAVKKDRLFVLILALVIANLSYQLIKTLLALQIYISCCIRASIFLMVLALANVVAIIGVLWLLQNYRRRRRIAKEEESNKPQLLG